MAADGQLPWTVRLLVRLLIPGRVRDEVEGDLAERFSEVERGEGRSAAHRWIAWQLVSLRPLALRRRGFQRAAEGDGGALLGPGWGEDVRLGLRALRLRPAASSTVMTTMALAVGVTTSVFTVVDGVLLRPLPFPDSDRLARVFQTNNEWRASPNSQLREFADRFPLSTPTFNDWTEANTGFEALGAYSGRSVVHQGRDGAEVLRGQSATSGLFQALGLEPLLGRGLEPPDDRVGAERVVVISERFWRDRFARRPDVLGATFALDAVPHVVVGVMPAEFGALDPEALFWTPLTETQKADGRNSQYLSVVGRLAQDVSLAGAGERLAAVQERLAREYPDTQADVGSRVVGLLDEVVGDVRPTLWFLLGAVGLVLTVATLNIANILTVSGLTRRREVAVKAALGAGSHRLVRGLFAESAVLAVGGGLLGVALAALTVPLLLGLVPPSVPRYEMIGLSPSVLGFGLGLTVLTTLAVGVLPAIQTANAHPHEVMRASGRATDGHRSGRLRGAIVTTELSLAYVLLVAAALLGSSYLRLWNVERGFATEGLIVLRAAPDPVEYPERDGRERFVRELRARFEAIPGVEVTASNQVPLSGSTSTTSYWIERGDGQPEEASVVITVGLENYLRVMRIPLVDGRVFTAADDGDAPPVAIVNEAMASALWPGESPIGRLVRSDEDQPWVEIVGVARNVRHQRLTTEAEPKLYIPAAQSGRSTNAWVLRVRGDVGAAVDLARRAVTAQSATTPLRGVQILEETISDSVAVPRFRALFVVGLAGLAAVLALLGVYGVVTFAVTQRAREIGVRMALGANRQGVVRGVIASALRLSVAGIGAGLVIAWRGTAYIADFLYEVEASDSATYLSISLLVLIVTAAAAYLPARRAVRVDPVTVLNSE